MRNIIGIGYFMSQLVESGVPDSRMIVFDAGVEDLQKLLRYLILMDSMQPSADKARA